MSRVRSALVVATTFVVAVASTVLVQQQPATALPNLGPHVAGGPVDGGVSDAQHWVVRVDEDALLADLAAELAPSATGPSATGSTLGHQAVKDDAVLAREDQQAIGVVRAALGHADPTGRRAVGLADVPDVVTVLEARVDEVLPLGGGRFAVSGALDADAVAALPGVVDVEADVLVHATATDPYLPQSWGLVNTGQEVQGVVGTAGADIDWSRARGRATGAGVVVAVIDSGVDVEHPDLASSIWRNVDEDCDNGRDDDGNGYVDDCHGWDFVNADATVHDGVDEDHGTHVAGTIAAAADNGHGSAGVAPGATIMPLKVIQGGSFPLSRAALAIDYAVANGAHVVNASFGSNPGAPEPTFFRDVIARAEAAGVVVVVAAGNDGVDIDRTPVWPASVDLPNVVTVGASDSSDRRASFSNHGDETVEVFAPGRYILATLPHGSYGYYSGTSMATPMVAGVAALLVERLGRDVAAVTDALYRGAEPVAALASYNRNGRVSAAGSLDALPAASVEITGRGLADLAAGPIDATLQVRADAGVLASLEVTLATWIEDVPHAVIGHEVTARLGADDAVATTDGGGRVRLADLTDGVAAHLAAGELDLGVATTLPDGRYAFGVEGFDDAGRSVGYWALLFEVGDGLADPDLPGVTPGPELPIDVPPVPGDDLPDTAPPTEDPDIAPAPDTPADTDLPDWSPPGDAPAGPPGAGTPGPGGTTPDEGVSEPAPPTTDVPGTDGPIGDGPQDDGAIDTPDAPDSPDAPDTDAPATSPVEGPTDGPGVTPPAPDSPVFPPDGPVTGGTVVRIEGRFANARHVRFGDQTVPVLLATKSFVLAMTQPHAAGTVDVAVLSPSGQVLASWASAYTFLAPGGGGGTTPPPSGGTTPGDGPLAPDAPDAPADRPVDGPVDDPVDEPGVDAPDEDAAPPGPTVGRPIELDNGLVVDRFVSGHPLWGLSAGAWDAAGCAATCDAVRLTA